MGQPRPLIAIIALLALVAVAVAGCDEAALPPSASGSALGHPAQLEGTTWSIAAAAGVTPAAGLKPVVWFDRSTVFGSTGCNSFSTSVAYDAASGAVSFGPGILTTKKACPPDRGRLEGAFLGALRAATIASVDGQGHLLLDGPAGQIVLVRSDQPRPTD